MHRTIDIPRVALNDFSKLMFNFKHYLPKRPMMILGGASSAALQKWTPHSLKELVGDKMVEIAFNRNGIFDYNADAKTGKVEFENMLFREAVSRIESNSEGAVYIQQMPIPFCLPELLPDLPRPSVLDSFKMILALNFWFGSRGCKTPLHYDRTDNFLVQILGTKRVTIFPPSDSPYLYPAFGKSMPHISRINVFGKDTAEFPMYSKAQPICFDLEPGNILYLPPKWWHAVESLETSISVNYWWAGPCGGMRFVLKNLVAQVAKKIMGRPGKRGR